MRRSRKRFVGAPRGVASAASSAGRAASAPRSAGPPPRPARPAPESIAATATAVGSLFELRRGRRSGATSVPNRLLLAQLRSLEYGATASSDCCQLPRTVSAAKLVLRVHWLLPLVFTNLSLGRRAFHPRGHTTLVRSVFSRTSQRRMPARIEATSRQHRPFRGGTPRAGAPCGVHGLFPFQDDRRPMRAATIPPHSGSRDTGQRGARRHPNRKKRSDPSIDRRQGERMAWCTATWSTSAAHPWSLVK